MVYVVAPAMAVVLTLAAASHRRTRRFVRRGRLAFTFSTAIVLGTALALVHALTAGAHVSLAQVGLAVYFTASLLLILMAFDVALAAALKWIWQRIRSDDDDDDEDGEAKGRARPGIWRRSLEPLPFVVRAALLVVVALPYLMATALTYRPKYVPRENPQSRLDVGYDTVAFETADGLTIVGWWVPAAQGQPLSRELQRSNFGRDTVIICHGFASGKDQGLEFAQSLLVRGYNVLMFDFRGHGESDGQLTSLGALERQDVLAAVRWLQDTRPRQSQRILGLGISTGAAALISAAADPSPQGQAIEAVALYNAYDDLSGLGRTIARTRFLPPLSWVADRVGLALASAHVGADLVHFAPADLAARLWPRPILVIHGGADLLVPFEHGQRLFDAAQEPKRHLWLPNSDHLDTLRSRDAAREVREFFNEARPVPSV